MLAAARTLVEHPLADEHEHEQTAGQRRLHDDEGREQERDDLQREAEHRQRRPRKPARPSGQLTDEADPQVVIGVDLARIERLKGNP